MVWAWNEKTGETELKPVVEAYYVSDAGVLVHNKCDGKTPATKRGHQMHKEWDYGPGVEKEVRIGKGARVDGLDTANRIVYELKSNNPRAIR